MNPTTILPATVSGPASDRPRGTHRRLAGFACILLLLACSAVASPRDGIVVTAPWLAKHLSDPNLVLLHVGDKAGYESGHIAGARLVSLDDISVSEHSATGLMLEMPAAEDLRQRLEALGISDRSHVVVYYGEDWVSPATRVVFTLDYAGLGDRATLLDGGMPAWVRNGGAVTKEIPAATKGSLAPLKIKPVVVDAKYVKDHVGQSGTAVVDGRAASYYDGKDTGDIHGLQRTGHIAGAFSIPYTEITDDHLMLKSPAELEELFAKAGVKPGDTVVGYCHIGQQATAMLFAARTLGHPVLLYDGSFQDWSRRTDYPVDNPSKKGDK